MFKRRTQESFGPGANDAAASPGFNSPGSPELREGPVQVITTPDGQEMAIELDGSLTPVEVIMTPEGKEVAKFPSGKVSPIVRTPIGPHTPINA